MKTQWRKGQTEEIQATVLYTIEKDYYVITKDNGETCVCVCVQVTLKIKTHERGR